MAAFLVFYSHPRPRLSWGASHWGEGTEDPGPALGLPGGAGERWAGLLVGVRQSVSCFLGKEQDRRRCRACRSGFRVAALHGAGGPVQPGRGLEQTPVGGQRRSSWGGRSDPHPPRRSGGWGVCEPTVLPWDGPGAALTAAPPTASPAALQLGLRHAAAPEGGGEEAVAPLSVADPCAEDLPGAAAAQTPEAREREPAPRAGRVGGPAPRRGADAPPRQVIGLLDVFTPAASIEDFSEV